MSALRDTENKLDWAMLFEHFPLAMQELCKARMYGARHYTKDGKDGVTNWKESINGPEHDKFFKGCIRGNISHNFKTLWGEQRDTAQDNVHHLAYGALNNLMALEYDLSKDQLPALGHGAEYRDEFLEYYKTLKKQDGLNYFIIDNLGYVYGTKFEPRLSHTWDCSDKTHMYEEKAPDHLQDKWTSSLRKIETDYACEIDQLVTWIGGDFKFWYFDENGFICYGHFAPKFSERSTLHSVAHHMTVTMVPEHLRKYWKESVRKRS